jgi:hypothetical protein
MLRVKTEIMVNAWLRETQSKGQFATIVRKGDGDAGLVAFKVYAQGNNARVFLETRDFDGNQAFRELTDGLMMEADADERLQKQVKFDPDLWIVEIENRDGVFFLEDKILSD